MVTPYARTTEPVPKTWYVLPLDGEETIAEMLRRLRTERSVKEGREVTQREVMATIGFEPEAQHLLSKYESGTIKQPPEETLNALAAYYGVDPDAMMRAAYRARRTKKRMLPKGSYAVPGDPVLLRHLHILRNMKVKDVEDLSRHAVQTFGLEHLRDEQEELG